MIRLFNNEIPINTILFGVFIVLFLFFMFTNIDVAIMLFISLVFACSLNPIVDTVERGAQIVKKVEGNKNVVQAAVKL